MTNIITRLIRQMPERLRERTRMVSPLDQCDSREYVVYWMSTALRASENPALDVALHLANELAIPAFVYLALPEQYPFASDRHHTFILEGIRDVQQQLRNRSIAFAFHLERPGHRGSYLDEIAARAALLVIEDMPVASMQPWTYSESRPLAPVVAVDTACVVPAQLVGRAYDRAFQYRDATRSLYQERVGRTYEPVIPGVDSTTPDKIPFQSLDLAEKDLAELVAQCGVDHSIAAVPHTRGGSSAGYQRWEEFKERGLDNYSKQRNDATIDGVSRLSSYLHHGMVAATRIAREAASSEAQGAAKFLDELLIWRELAYAFCRYRTDHDQLSALPIWAVDSLREHELDPRPALLSWEQLARGKTGDELWDAAQRSLLMHGELHNNVRMTWGKALLAWTANATETLATMIDLNHRYALDGQDPASYGGILWCLGQFDRAFTPEKPIFGVVRDRSTKQHTQRIDLQKYVRKTTRPLYANSPRVAVVGAGLSGLICARTLSDHGIDVKVFEKSRGVGGRMATRRAADGLTFDHGAQYFTVRDERFRRYVDSWLHDGIVRRWEGKIVVLKGNQIEPTHGSTDRYVAQPGMNAICKHLAADLDVCFETTVLPLTRSETKWNLNCAEGQRLGDYDYVVVSAPPSQTATLLKSAASIARVASETQMNACWAVMAAFNDTVPVNFDGAFVHDSPLSWVARNSSKPGREHAADIWVLHASQAWSSDHLEDSAEQVSDLLLDEFVRLSEASPKALTHCGAHRWRFAIPPEPLTKTHVFDSTVRAAACGDWCGGPRVEGAFLSGMATAGRLMGDLSHVMGPPSPSPVRQLGLF